MVRVAALCLVAALAGACTGHYGHGSGMASFTDQRGDTNGRSFDFVSTKPDGGEWTIRVRGNSLWVAYSKGTRSDELGSIRLDDHEMDKLWTLVDRVDVPHRRRGTIDRVHGTVSLHLREVTSRGGHDLEETFVSRDTADDDVLDLADYLATLIEHHKKERPAF
jgi:hypothetical protein